MIELGTCRCPMSTGMEDNGECNQKKYTEAINDSGTCTQEMICRSKVQILLKKFGPRRCFMSTGLEHSGECSHRRPTEAVSDMIGDTCLILNVDMELLQVGGPLLMVIVM